MTLVVIAFLDRAGHVACVRLCRETPATYGGGGSPRLLATSILPQFSPSFWPTALLRPCVKPHYAVQMSYWRLFWPHRSCRLFCQF